MLRRGPLSRAGLVYARGVRGWVNSHAAGLVVVLLGLALVAPGANFQLWNGLPLDSLPELLGAAILVPLMFSRKLRRQLIGLGASLHPRPVRTAAIVVVAILGLKLVLLVSGIEVGFRGCYGSPVSPPPSGGCERSYTNLFDRYGGATRIDSQIAFGGRTGAPPPGLSQSTWRLPFVDDLRFDVPATPANPAPRERLPLSVRWTGNVSTTPGAAIVVSYVGEGEVRVGATRRVLPQSYLGVQDVRVPTAGGNQAFSLAYTFNPLISIGPYASVRASIAHGTQMPEGGQLLHSAPPPATWRVIAFLDDGALVLLLLLIAVGQARAIGNRDGIFLLSVLALGWLVLVDFSPWKESLYIAALAAALLLFRPRHPLIVSWYALLFLCSLHPLLSSSSPGEVLYRTSGNDWLTYESQARSMLYGSLRGGEGVFYYQPGWRYILFLERALVGDGDILRPIFTYVTVTLPLVALGFWTLRSRQGLRVTAATAALVAVSVAVINSPDVRVLLTASASESVTWALIPLLVAIPFVVPRARWPWVLAPAAAALTVAIRPNHLIAAMVLIVAFAWAAPVKLRRWLIAGTGLAAFVVLLPTLHDTIYGHRFLHLALTSGTTSGTLEIPPSDLLKVFSDGAVQSKLWAHVEQIFYITSPPGAYSTTLAVLLPVLLFSWLAIVVLTIWRWRSIPVPQRIAAAVPAAYLAPHVIYQVGTYFPRHIVAGYLAMASVTLGVLGTDESSARAPASARRRRRPLAMAAVATKRLRSRPG
jgi:hypothetical protein